MRYSANLIASILNLLSIGILTVGNAFASPATPQITGTWNANDGGLYYIRQLGNDVWWVGLSTSSPGAYRDFFKGLQFTNVFHGTVSGSRITGAWADVPRGETLSNGSLVLDVLPDTGSGLTIRRVSETGGFGAEVWHNSFIVTPPTQCSNRPGIRCEYDNVHKNDGSTLYDNLKPEKDYIAIFGWLRGGLSLGYPASGGRNYSDFISAWNRNNQDGDLNFDFQVDQTGWDTTGFWTDGWEYSDGPSIVRSKLAANQNQLHCEIIMYGRSDANHPPLLPGWMETSPNSTLWNGVPINGFVLAGPPPTIGGASINSGQRIRVSGVLNLDCGHFPYNCENSDPAEIHPVYSVDVEQDWTHRQSGADLTGVWAGNDVGTYYIRQIGNTVWWIGISRDQGHGFANVFQGTIGTETIQSGVRSVINGNWVDVPLGRSQGAGTLKLVGTYCLPNGCNVNADLRLYNRIGVWVATGSFGGTSWEKLYDRGSNASSGLSAPATHPQ